MKTACRSLPLLLVLALVAGTARAGTAGGEAPRTQRAGVGGHVLGEVAPLPAAGVYAYQLADLSVRKVLTDTKGNFLFQDLPAGLYKIIAHKPGFIPVVVMLTRTAAQNYQFVELQLSERPLGAANAKEGEDFWSIRSRIPGDVLRDIEEGDGDRGEETPLVQLYPLGSGQQLDLGDLAKAGFRTEMQAMTGVDQIAALGDGQVSGAGLGIKGTVGDVQVGLRGNFWSFNGDPASIGGPGTGGQASALSLDLRHGSSSHVIVSSLTNRLVGRGRGEGHEMEPIDFEHYKVNWTQEVGEKGRSEVSAQYTAENNYHRQGAINPLAIPEASQTFWVEGAYTTALGDRNMLQTGLRYRERQFGLSASLRPDEVPVSESIDAFSRGGVRVRPAVLLEYGLYSTLSDGSLSLMPQGGIVLQLGSNWQVQGNASRKVYEDTRLDRDFLPSLFEESDLCEQGSSACYQVGLSRQLGEDQSLSFSATHREIGETLRLYFSNDLFDRGESLYLVQGDELPEMRVELTKKLSPQVLTKLESSVATGGGGTFVAADRRSYENQIRYMVTSLDTQFLGSSTGVFVAFHHLSQELQPLDRQGPSAQVDLERLRLQVTQDLGFLMDLTADWAVQLNMELSRGPVSSDLSRHEDELRRRLMGGIAVKF
jgi:hypothetical protein